MKVCQKRVAVGVSGSAAVIVLLLGGAYGMSASAVGTRLGVIFGCTDRHTPDMGGHGRDARMSDCAPVRE